MQAGLYIVGTPLGNLSDFSPRARETLANADFIAAEDTRVFGKLAEKFDIKTQKISLHEHNEDEKIESILDKVRGGAAVALVSDAGMPAISDPGFKLVRAARAENLPVFSVPGATAFATALAISGFPTDRFSFLGFLPNSASARVRELTQAARWPGTIVYYESPNRIMDTISDLAKIMPERKIAVARELTKMFEQVVIGYPGDFPKFETRGEMVLLIEPAAPLKLSDDDIREIVNDVVASAATTKDAANEIARRTGISKSDAYAATLRAKK